ncbi:expressed unknown protein [Seminavis robusta]|uniref:Uncharacterized protein n=1 Tax=Seminavis robusta TaxID=568900 RepID=A0A9N8EU31_9STRA|nr:expressed unknown protein [Seminavis robusta]|eukprot:Sro1689_g291331.1  (121) ;mRNA; f:23954-24316
MQRQSLQSQQFGSYIRFYSSNCNCTMTDNASNGHNKIMFAGHGKALENICTAADKTGNYKAMLAALSLHQYYALSHPPTTRKDYFQLWKDNSLSLPCGPNFDGLNSLLQNKGRQKQQQIS